MWYTRLQRCNSGCFLIFDNIKEHIMAVAHVTEDEQALIEAIGELARERVAPRAAEIDHTGEFPWDMKELLAQQDIYAMPFPVEYGGLAQVTSVFALTEPEKGTRGVSAFIVEKDFPGFSVGRIEGDICPWL
jgi:alkylation response protein AidB-like acyl-CoA dehydrogenase